MAAKVTIGLDDRQLQAGLSGSTAAVKRFASQSESAADQAGKAIKNAFAFAGGIAAVQQLGSAVKNLLSEFDDIADAATKLNVSAESFQRIKLQAELSGASVDGLTTALLKMEAGLARGGAEGEKLTNALVSLGINTASFTAAKPEEKIALLSAAFQKARAEGRGLSEIQDLFKKQFTELIPLLSASSAEMAKLAQQKVVSDEDVARLAAANDALDAFVVSLKVAAGTSLATLMKDFEFVDQKVRSITGGLAGIRQVMDVIAGMQSFGLPQLVGQAQSFMSGGAAPPSASPTAVPLTTTTTGVSIPGLEAATGRNTVSLGIPGLDAATNPQSGAAERTATTRDYKPLDKDMVSALKRNNEILEKIASYQ